MPEKKVNFELVDKFTDPTGRVPSEPYALLEKVRAECHPHLAEARFVLLWRKNLAEDRDGHLMLGKCVKASDMHRQLHDSDFAILLNKDAWDELSPSQREALIDHELSHADLSLDEEGEPKRDESGAVVWRTRKHDLEEFRAVVERRGLYLADLEAFADSILKHKKQAAQTPLFPPNGVAGRVGG